MGLDCVGHCRGNSRRYTQKNNASVTAKFPANMTLSASGNSTIRSDGSTSSALADRELESWITEVRENPGPSCAAVGVQALRADSEARAKSRVPGPELPIVKDLSADTGLSLRLYRASHEEKPMVIYLHGGGFVFGDLNSHDGICRRLALMADVAVLAVDYRRAPENPSPAAVDDAVSAYTWAVEHLSELGGSAQNGVALAGDSAGGAIALLAATRLVEDSMSPSALFLGYPNADMTLGQQSITAKGNGWSLDSADLSWFVEQWVPDPSRRDYPTVSPIHASLHGLPAVMLITAEHDPLRDEGELLAEKLRGANVPTCHYMERGLVHGFFGLTHISPAAEHAASRAFADSGKFLREATNQPHAKPFQC